MEAGEDLTTYETLLSEFQDVFSTFGVRNVNKLYHFLFIILEYSQQLQNSLGQGVENIWNSLMTSPQQTAYASSSTENASMDMEIIALFEHQSQSSTSVAQPEPEPIRINEVSMQALLKASAIPFKPKGKGRTKRVSYADAVKQDSKSDDGRPSSPSLTVNKKKQKTAPISKLNKTGSSQKAPKKQTATPAPKTISTMEPT
ncbi:unnamed protein product [Rhizophagus irregularis]|uniref:Uncharacterized protein n=1 Tax=Rhizophagus irregularis TaxID=588596 RepID=A0A915ZJT4_9GLOM|nr:unnamed protein product [Rhizophagus irregularis]